MKKMKKRITKANLLVVLAAVMMLLGSVSVWASDDDNSLSSLGILTEGATVEPEFSYDKWEYTVTVPAGTTELQLDPVPSSSGAAISDISGTAIGEDGTTQVTITVRAANGNSFPYVLNVVTDASTPAAAETEAQTEPQTEKQTEKETEPETEDTQYVKVDKNSLQEAENTITSLKGEITKYKDTVSLFTKIMYGLIGLAVILLFIVINLLLKKKDLKAELKAYRSYGYTTGGKVSKKEMKQAKKQAKKQADMQEMDQDFEMPAQPVQPMQQKNQQPMQQNGQYMQNQNAAQQAGGVNVQPQKSQKKAKQMPRYEQPAQPVMPEQTPASAPKQDKGSKGGKKKKDDVQINMIDL